MAELPVVLSFTDLARLLQVSKKTPLRGRRPAPTPHQAWQEDIEVVPCGP
jgi:hypothetical protein